MKCCRFITNAHHPYSRKHYILANLLQNPKLHDKESGFSSQHKLIKKWDRKSGMKRKAEKGLEKFANFFAIK